MRWSRLVSKIDKLQCFGKVKNLVLGNRDRNEDESTH